MRTLFLLLLLSAPALAGGPKYRYEDVKLNDEVANIYHDIGAVLKGTIGPLNISSMTVSSATINYIELNLPSTQSSFVGATNVPTTTEWGDLTSIPITAGTWEVDLNALAASNGATMTRFAIGVSTTSGNNSTLLVLGDTSVQLTYGSTSLVDVFVPINLTKVLLTFSEAKTVYFKMSATYTVGTPTMRGRITATPALN